jgi:hypothetical protein
MSDTPSFEDFDRAIRRLGEALYNWVISQMSQKPWQRATLEVRYAHDGTYWHDKIRVEIPGQPDVSLGTTNEIAQILIELNKLRRMFHREWYTMRLQISNDRKVEVKYGHDPNAAEDASFFED